MEEKKIKKMLAKLNVLTKKLKNLLLKKPLPLLSDVTNLLIKLFMNVKLDISELLKTAQHV